MLTAKATAMVALVAIVLSLYKQSFDKDSRLAAS